MLLWVLRDHYALYYKLLVLNLIIDTTPEILTSLLLEMSSCLELFFDDVLQRVNVLLVVILVVIGILCGIALFVAVYLIAYCVFKCKNKHTSGVSYYRMCYIHYPLQTIKVLYVKKDDTEGMLVLENDSISERTEVSKRIEDYSLVFTYRKNIV